MSPTRMTRPLRTIFLGDIGNRLDIEDAEQEIARMRRDNRQARSKISTSTATINQLKGELEQQNLAIQSLTRFLIEKKIVDQAELEEFIQDVDAEDGVVDGILSIKLNNGRLQMQTRTG